jgi:hypothetical protein
VNSCSFELPPGKELATELCLEGSLGGGGGGKQWRGLADVRFHKRHILREFPECIIVR